MIGKVTFDFGGKPVTATLGDDRKWSVGGVDPGTARLLADTLETLFGVGQAGFSPADGFLPERRLVRDAAAHFGGEADVPGVKIPDDPPGAVY